MSTSTLTKRQRSGAFELALMGSPFAISSTPAADHELIDFASLGLVAPISGGRQGAFTAGDVLTQTTDGRDLNALWDLFQQALQVQNERRQPIIDALTFPVTSVIEDVPQTSTVDFEEASEFGLPRAVRNEVPYLSLAYDFRWYDLGTRFTWKALADATAAQVETLHQQALEADNRLIFQKVMRTIFNPTNIATDINKQAYTVYKLYNADGTVPPTYGASTFDGTHSHYLVSGAATFDSGDLESLIGTIEEHGYQISAGTTMVVMANKVEATIIRRFRANVANNNGAVALYDFIPATGEPGFIVPTQAGLVGSQPSNTYNGLRVIGSYGGALIVEEAYIPVGYVMAFASGGPGNAQNPVGFREHANASLRGLRQLPGDRRGYPLLDSYYSRGFGTGIRQRGAAAVIQVKASGSYAAPTIYA